jgi:hypothetical protein
VDHSKPEVANELSRARKLISEQFVNEMKDKMKNVVLQRMEAEKKVNCSSCWLYWNPCSMLCSQSKDAALEGEDCPICLDVMGDSAVVTACKHAFCKECISKFLFQMTVWYAVLIVCQWTC